MKHRNETSKNTVRALILTFCTVLWLTSLGLGKAEAFEPTGYKWPGSHPRIPFYVSTSLSGNIPYDGTYEQAIEAIQNAANAWNDVGASEAQLVYAGQTEVDEVANDGINAVIFKDEQCPYGGLCTGWITYHVHGDKMVGFDIVLYSTMDNTSWPVLWSVKEFPDPLDMDLWFIVAHEFGHALGLDHSEWGGTLMNPAGCGMGCFVRQPQWDDVDGVHALYGEYTNEGLSPSTTLAHAGETFTLDLDYKNATNEDYAVMLSVVDGQHPLYLEHPHDSRILPIENDFFPIEDYPNIFVNFDGELDANGKATATVKLPVCLPEGLQNQTLYFSIYTFNCSYLNCYEDVGVRATVNIADLHLARRPLTATDHASGGGTYRRHRSNLTLDDQAQLPACP